VEHTWILALGLKALHRLLQSSSAKEVVEKLLSAGLVPSVVKVACKPTHFSQKWQLADLEVLGIQSYHPASPKKSKSSDNEAGGEDKAGNEDKVGDEAKARDGAEEEKEENKNERSESPTSPATDESILEGLSDEIQEMLKVMHEAFQCPLSVLRALYEASGDDLNQFLMSSEQHYDMEAGELKPPDEILEAAKKWFVQ